MKRLWEEEERIMVSDIRVGVLALAIVVSQWGVAGDAKGPARAVSPGVQVRVTVTDAKDHSPVELAHVMLRDGKRIVAQDATNPLGVVRFREIEPGQYEITAWFVGYAILSRQIRVDQGHSAFALGLSPEGTVVSEVDVVGQHLASASHIDPLTGNQVFESHTYHAPPTAGMTELIQQNMIGAVRAPTGEVHIRGMHGEYTYYIDGVPVPLGVFGGLNEIVDPKVIDRVTFMTGGFPAEYGGQMAAIINLDNRVPAGSFHLDVSTYAGSYLVFNGTKPFSPGSGGASSPGDTLGARVGPFRALNANGQSLRLSDHLGDFGFFLSGSRQETDRRIDTPVPQIFHDHGFDYFLYGKFDYLLGDDDYITANLNVARTRTQVPFDSLEAVASDLQQTTNAFQNVSYFHAFNADVDHESSLFAGGYIREGELIYTPGSIDRPNFVFGGDSTTKYLLSEDRRFTTVGLRTTYDRRFSHQVMIKVGGNISSTKGTDAFSSRDSRQNPGPNVGTSFIGSDAGVFGEAEVHPAEWTSFEIGLRYDQHRAPDAPTQSQVSPRIKWNFLLGADDHAYLYYGRLFMPTNIEGLRSITLNVANSLTPTLPDREDMYEAVYMHTFASGFRAKVAGYVRRAAPGIDDETVGNTAIKTPVNIAVVHTSGIDVGLTYDDASIPLSGYVNASLIHAYGTGPVTGGFLDVNSDGSATDLDHDQRLSMVVGLDYQPSRWFASLTAIYGSGLTNGNPDRLPYRTGLLDFNTAQHTAPSTIVNCSLGFLFPLVGGAKLEPSLYVSNLLDHMHLIKGAYFSGASWEEPRKVILRIDVHM
jgi:hypothetical protein